MNLFIGCSCEEKIDKNIIKKSKELIKEIASIDNIDLVYSNCIDGLGGVCYEEFRKNNKKIIGVQVDKFRELQDQAYSDKEIIVKNGIDRFKNIYDNSDIFLILPGGFGTISEIFNLIEEYRIDDKKRIIIYNLDGYYNDLIKIMDNLFDTHFASVKISDCIDIVNSKKEVINIIKEEL